MRIPSFLLLIAGMYLLSGCMSQKKPTDKYYVIEKNDSLETFTSAQQPWLDGYCEIVPVQVYPAYATQQIAKKNKTHEITYYRYHHWAVRPEEALNLLIEDHLNRTSLFKRVSRRYWRINPAYKLETTVYKLEIQQQQETYQGHIAFRFDLFHIPSGDLLVSHEADRTEDLTRRDINLFAQTVGNILHQELNEFAKKTTQQIQTNQ